jgi:hypothetical protein
LGLLAAGVTSTVLLLGFAMVGLHLFVAAAFPHILGQNRMSINSILERYHVIDAVRWLRLPPEESADPGAGGRILEQIMEMDPTGQWVGDRIHESTIAGSPLLGLDPFGSPYRLDTDSLVTLALQGFSEEEKAYLAGFGGDPRLPLFERLAELPRYDPTWYGVLGEDDLTYSLPIPRYGELREVARHNTARAALAAAEGDFDAAELYLRQTLSVGLLLADNDSRVIGTLVGALIGKYGAHGLEEVYRARGRDEEAARMRRAWAPPNAGEGMDAVLSVREAGQNVVEDWSPLGILSDSTLPPGLRWETLRGLPLVQSCGSLEWILWGPPEQFTRLMEQVRAQLVRYPGEEALFRGMIEEPERIASLSWEDLLRQYDVSGVNGAFLPWMGDVAAKLTGNPRIDACTKTVTLFMGF